MAFYKISFLKKHKNNLEKDVKQTKFCDQELYVVCHKITIISNDSQNEFKICTKIFIAKINKNEVLQKSSKVMSSFSANAMLAS